MPGTETYQFTHAAGYEGSIVVSNAIFHLPRKVNYTFVPWCTYTDPELASIGMNEKRAKEAGVEYDLWVEEFKDNDRSLAEGEQVGRIKMLLDKKGKPIGVQILGPRAGDLISEWVAALNGGVKPRPWHRRYIHTQPWGRSIRRWPEPTCPAGFSPKG